MAPATIKITYDLKPPANIDIGEKEASKTHTFEVKSDNTGGAEFYTALRKSLTDARNVLGDEMTAWRDVVGKSELGKEPKQISEEDEEDDEEEEQL